MHDDFTIIHDYPESVLFTLSTDYFSLALLNHLLLDIISNRYYCRCRIGITYYEIVRNSCSDWPQIKRNDILTFFSNIASAITLSVELSIFSNIIIFAKTYKDTQILHHDQNE